MTTSTQTQLRRGTASGNDALIGAAGEVTIDETNNRARVHDGTTLGGRHLPNHADIQNQSMVYGAVGGTANALSLTLSPAPAAYGEGMGIEFIPGSTNTASATINVNGLGAVTFKKNVSGTLTNLAAGDLPAGVKRRAVHDGTYFQVSVDQASGLSSVSQGNINTSTGSVAASMANGGAKHLLGTMPGGEYAFGFETKGSLNYTHHGYIGNTTTAYVRKGYGSNDGAGPATITIQERYVTSSPPFDLGDGELAGFIYLRLNKAGEVVGSYIADVPPWAYNGPTRIRADHVCPITGTKFRRVKKRRSLDEIIGGAPFEYELQEITQAIKNADMPLIPHPFEGMEHPDETIVLLNPRDDRLARLMEHHNNGGDEEILDALHAGKIYADNEFLRGMKGPPGVAIAPLCYKYSRLR